MFRNKIIISLLLVAVVLIIVLVVGKKQGWIGGGKALEVSTEEISTRSITEKVSASGKIYPQREVIISPDVSGEVIELYVKEGDSVTLGQTLVKIKPDIYQAILDRAVAALNTTKANYLQAKASLTQATAEFERAEKTYNRNKSLHEQKVISDAEWETIESAYKSALASLEGSKLYVEAAQFNVQSAEASVKESSEDLRKTTMYAPMSGIITRLNIEKGERVLGTTQMQGTDMLHISDLNAIETWVDVSENDVLRVKSGDTSVIKLDAYPGKVFKGLVTQIGRSAKEASLGQSEQVTNFQVKILMIRESYKEIFDSIQQQFPFLPGMSVSVEILTKSVRGVLAVPIQSVTTRADTSKQKGESKDKGSGEQLKEVVYVNDNGKARMVFVTTGIQDDEYIQINSGLKGNEQIVSGPFSAISRMLKDGDAIKVVEKEKLFKADESKK